jgi:YspA, cpYpsA-related SLOG family
MRLLVCGSRDWDSPRPIEIVLEGHGQFFTDNLTVIEGGAKGADRIAGKWAAENRNTPLRTGWIRVSANWREHGNAAGPIRNGQMLECEPDVVWAFVNKPLTESHGTHNMVGQALDAGLRVYVVEEMRP